MMIADMGNLSDLKRSRMRRPYWLLLALALFFAGQVAVSGHWHDDTAKLDNDCALCVLSSATSGAIVDSALPQIAAVLFATIFLFTPPVTQRVIHRYYESRAPPIRF